MTGSPEYYKGQYAGLKFAPFKQQEYPKILYRDDARKAILGTANNAMEEKELYASIGVEKSDIDPAAAMADELAVLRAKLAQYEGVDVTTQLAAKPGITTASVQMLPEDSPKKVADVPVVPKGPSTSGAGNPLLKPVAPAAGAPAPVGSAPKVESPIKVG